MSSPHFRPYLIKLVAWDLNGNHCGMITERGNADTLEQVKQNANALFLSNFDSKRDQKPYCKEIKIYDDEGKEQAKSRNFKGG